MGYQCALSWESHQKAVLASQILVLCGSPHRRRQHQSVGKSPVATVIYKYDLVLSVKS